MRAHLLQMDLPWEDREASFGRMDTMLARTDVRPGDLVVAPEMFDSGFSFATERTADRDNRTRNYLSSVASDLGCTVHGSRTVVRCRPMRGTAPGNGVGAPANPEGAGCEAENCATVFGPDGSLLVEYAKVHPFSYSGESERFRGGEGPALYRWEAGGAALSVCPAVCYDLRFPELFRLGALMGAECFVIGANWPAARREHWRALLCARAIENQAYVLGVNRCGRDPNTSYAGGSVVFGPRGETVGEIPAGDDAGEGVLSVSIDAAAVHGWREQFPALRDVRLCAPGVGLRLD